MSIERELTHALECLTSRLTSVESRIVVADTLSEKRFEELREALSDVLVLKTTLQHIDEQVDDSSGRIRMLEIESARMKTEVRWLTAAGAVVIGLVTAWLKGVFL